MQAGARICSARPWQRQPRLPEDLLTSEKFFKEMKMMKKLSMSVLATFFMLTVSACSTVEGIGKDIKKGGDAIEKAAK